MYWIEYVRPLTMVISRWRTWASQGFTPLLVTSVQYCPSLMNERPVPGALNEFIQGMDFPPSKLTFLMRSCPDSFGTSMPGDPFVGAAFQSFGAPRAVAAGPGPAGAAAVAGGWGACEAQPESEI